MSSNAFARSRPRVRHQRVPKTQCYAHPRFLKLVNELVRLDDVKKKQEELEQQNNGNSGAKTRSNVSMNTVSACATNDDCSNSTNTSEQHTVSSHPQQHSLHRNGHTHPAPPIQAPTQQPVDCWPINISLNNSSCCRNLNEAHSSNGCRSLECNRSSSALNDTYYRQNGNDNLPISNHGLHQNYPRHYGYASIHQNATINNLSHHSQHNYRCPPSKCTVTSTATTNTNLGCSKASPIDQSATDFSNSDSDPRQDENRTKRKRSGNDPSNCSKKLSQPTSPSSCNKRHKASPEPVRPLSPSFTKCPICLLDCMDRDPSFTNTCFHLFCYVCIENWSKSKATCPLCRTKFTKIIYNIRSASCFDEKVASPIRRDDDDDRIIYEQLHGLNANTIGSARAPTGEEARLMFDNIRNNQHGDGMSHFALLNHSLNRQMSTLQSFNSVVTNSNFNPAPHGPPYTTYNPVGSGYIALISSSDRSQTSTNGPAITSAYATDTSLTNSSGETSNRVLPRTSRSGRFIYPRNYDLTTIDGTARVSRSTNTEISPSGISLEPRHHHHQMPHGSHHQHHNQHSQSQQQHRATTTIPILPHRQVQRIDHHQHIPSYMIPARHYTNPHMYSRRPYTNPPTEQHILDLYRQMPDM
jgi:hypothetical protein